MDTIVDCSQTLELSVRKALKNQYHAALTMPPPNALGAAHCGSPRSVSEILSRRQVFLKVSKAFSVEQSPTQDQQNSP